MSGRPTIAAIKARVAEHYGVTVNDLDSARKTRDVSAPRHIAMWLCRELTQHAPTQIGRDFGDRDRKTVVNAWARVDARMAADPALRAEVVALAAAIAASARATDAGCSPVRDTALALHSEARTLEERAARLVALANKLIASTETGGSAPG